MYEIIHFTICLLVEYTVLLRYGLKIIELVEYVPNKTESRNTESESGWMPRVLLSFPLESVQM